MPYVVVDTNALIHDYLLVDAHVQTFLRGCQRCHIAVYIPEVVVDELVGNYQKDLTRLANEYQSVGRKLERFGVRTAALKLEIKKAIEHYREHVHRLMREHGATIIPYPAVQPKALVEASYSGRKPFKDSGEGFKDFLIFESLKSVATNQGSPGWFVTANTKDFCESGGQLHPDLQSALQNSAALTVFTKLHEFNASVLSPQLEVLDDIAARIRSGQFSGFNLDDGLLNIFINELCEKHHPLEDTGTPLDEPTTMSVGTPKTDELTVSRLEDDELLLEVTGTIELEIFGFIPKGDLYGFSETETEDIYINDHDWNEWVVSASTTKEFQFAMTVIFDETAKRPESVSIELEPSSK